MVADPLLSRYLRKLLFDEIVPEVRLPDAERRAYAESVLERFGNPFIRHELIAITLNSVSKWRVRILPTVKDALARGADAPSCLAFSLAALLWFYRGRIEGDAYLGSRAKGDYPIRDDSQILGIMADAWADAEPGAAGETAMRLLADARLWGEKLTALGSLGAQTRGGDRGDRKERRSRRHRGAARSASIKPSLLRVLVYAADTLVARVGQTEGILLPPLWGKAGMGGRADPTNKGSRASRRYGGATPPDPPPQEGEGILRAFERPLKETPWPGPHSSPAPPPVSAKRPRGLFVAAGWRVIATGRRADRLDALVASLGAERPHPAAFDVRDEAARDAALASLPAEFRDIDLLINNAGLALGTKPAQQADLAQWKTMIDTNVTALVSLTHKLLPGLIARRGAIINISSVAATYPYAGGNVYGGTKAFVKQFSLGLRTDLHGTGVRVTSIEPGMVETEFTLVRTGGDQAASDTLYGGVNPMTADDIAATLLWVAELPPHLNVNRLEMMPVSQSFAGFQVARNG